MKIISKKNIIIFAIIYIISVISITTFAVFAIPDIQEPAATISSSKDTLWPNGTRLDVPRHIENMSLFHIIIQNFSFRDFQYNVDSQPPVIIVKKNEPTPIDVVIVPNVSGEHGNFYTATAFTYCAPLYLDNGKSRQCIEKDMNVFLTQHIVPLNQYFNVTVTVPDNVPTGLYQLGMVVRTLAYSNDSDKPSNYSVITPFWIKVI